MTLSEPHTRELVENFLGMYVIPYVLLNRIDCSMNFTQCLYGTYSVNKELGERREIRLMVVIIWSTYVMSSCCVLLVSSGEEANTCSTLGAFQVTLPKPLVHFALLPSQKHQTLAFAQCHSNHAFSGLPHNDCMHACKHSLVI